MVFTAVCGEIAVPAAEVRPVIDGRLEDAAWQSIAWQEGFTVLESGSPAFQRTRFKVSGDRYGVYLAVSCTDEDLKTACQPQDSALWHDDSIEIFLVPEAEVSSDPNIREFYQFIVNASGSMFEAHNIGGASNFNWNTPWRAAAARSADGWDAEIFIPFSSLELKKRHTDWRFNIVRNDRGGKHRAVYTWRPLFRLADISGYGRLKGLNIDFQRYSAELSGFDFQVRAVDGSPVLAAEAKVGYRPGQRLDVQCAAADEHGFRSLSSRRVEIPESGSVVVSIPTEITASGNYRFQFYVMDADGVIACREIRRSVTVAPMQITMLKPVYRRQIMAGRPDKDVLLSCRLTMPLDDAALYSLAARAVDGGGKTVWSETKRNPGPAETFAFDASGLAPGSYRVELTFLKEGEAQGDAVVDFRVTPPALNEIWLNDRRETVVNGQPWFPRGFIGAAPAVFPLLKKFGYNLVQMYTLNRQDIPRILEVLDAARENDLKLTMYPFFRMSPGFFGLTDQGKTHHVLPPEGRRHIIEMVHAVKDHPAFFGWYLYDEPRGAAWCAQLKEVYELLRELDPHHPVLGLDNSPWGCINKAAHCDIHILDLYPSPRKSSGNYYPVAGIFNAVAQMNAELKNEGVWYCPQAFDYDSFASGENDYRAPTYEETRCSVYTSLAAGATGIIPYKIGNPDASYFQRHSNSGIFASPEMKVGFLDGMGLEMKALSSVYLSETLNDAVRSDAAGLRILAKKYNGKYFIFAVNPTPQSITAELTHSLSVNSWKVLCEEREIRSGAIKDVFGPYAVHIYTDDGAFPDPVLLREVRAKIDAELKTADNP
jgi:hypothetical protein